MLKRSRLICIAAIAGTLVQTVPTLSAASDTWTDGNGKSFRGEPAAIIGPVALFITGRRSTERILLRDLSPEDCVRFQKGLDAIAPRANDWEHATGKLTKEFIGRLTYVDVDSLKPVAFDQRPEPEYLILFYGTESDQRSRHMIAEATPLYEKMRHDYPGLVEGIFIGMRHDAQAHRVMAVDYKIPWLVTDYFQQKNLRITAEFAPRKAPAIIILNRNAAIITNALPSNAQEVEKCLNNLVQLLDADRPGAPRSAQDRMHYYSAVNPALHKDSSCDPILILDPIDHSALANMNVYDFKAATHVSAEGKVDKVTMKASEGVPMDIAKALGGALYKAQFVPAVKNGEFVEGSYDYSIHIEH